MRARHTVAHKQTTSQSLTDHQETCLPCHSKVRLSLSDTTATDLMVTPLYWIGFPTDMGRNETWRWAGGISFISTSPSEPPACRWGTPTSHMGYGTTPMWLGIERRQKHQEHHSPPARDDVFFSSSPSSSSWSLSLSWPSSSCWSGVCWAASSPLPLLPGSGATGIMPPLYSG